MGLTLPNPTVPTNGQPLDATPILQNILAIAQAIQSFDASQVAAGTLLAAAFNSSINPNTLMKETSYPFVSTGLAWSTISGLNVGMTSGVLYYNGIRVSVLSVSSQAMAASKDTYIDIDVNGNITYQAVTNGSASPALTTNSIRVAIIVSGASSITFINQGQIDTTLSGFGPTVSSILLSFTDSIGNIIYPNDPQQKMIGYRQITADQGSITTQTDIVGLAVPFISSGRAVKATAFIPMTNATSDAYNQGFIMESSTQLQAASANSRSGSVPEHLNPDRTLIPSAGLHTYKLQATGNGGTATVRAGSTAPAFLRIERD